MLINLFIHFSLLQQACLFLLYNCQHHNNSISKSPNVPCETQGVSWTMFNKHPQCSQWQISGLPGSCPSRVLEPIAPRPLLLAFQLAVGNSKGKPMGITMSTPTLTLKGNTLQTHGQKWQGYLRVYKGIKGLQEYRYLHGLCTIPITCSIIINTLNTTHVMF